MEVYNKKEEERFQKNQKLIENRRNYLKDHEKRQLRGEEEITDAMMESEMLNNENRGISRGNERSRRNNQDDRDKREDNEVPEDEDEDDDEGEDDEDEDEEGDEGDEGEEDADSDENF